MTWDEKSLSHVPELSHGTLGIHRNPATATQTDDADAAAHSRQPSDTLRHGGERAPRDDASIPGRGSPQSPSGTISMTFYWRRTENEGSVFASDGISWPDQGH